MKKKSVKDDLPEKPKMRPARHPADRSQQLIAAAYKLAEERLLNGTASSAEIVFWLKEGSPKTILERENLVLQNKLVESKINAIESEQTSAREYKEALDAFRGYAGLKDADVIEGEFYE